MLKGFRKLMAFLLATMMIVSYMPLSVLAEGFSTGIKLNIETLSVIFKAEGSEDIVYNAGEELSYKESDDAYYFITTPAEPSIPEGMVAFRGWFLDGSSDPFDFKTPVTTNLVLTAKFSNTWLIKYKDGYDNVVFTRELITGTAIYEPPQSVLDHVYVTAPEGSHFDYWTLEGEADRFTFGVGATKDITLVPKFSDHYYVIYVSAGTQVDPVLVKNGETATPPEPPSREGYSFQHWSTEESGDAFNFNTAITANTTLYAVWKGLSVNYTVAIWFEKPNFDGTPTHEGGNKANYNFAKSIELSGISGTLTEVGAGTAGIGTLFTTGTDPLLKYGDFQDAEQQIIQGNGLTVVNLYATRKVYTYTFDLGNNSSDTMKIVANGATYTGGGTKYTLSVKYEMDISNKFPVQGLTTVATFSSGFSSWERPSTMKWKDSANIASRRNLVEESMLSENGQTKNYTFTADWSASGSTYKYRYFAQAWSGQTGTSITRGSNPSVTYILMEEYNQEYRGDLGQKTINGLNTTNNDKYVTYYLLSNGTYTTNKPSNGSYETHRCFFYTRNAFKLTFNMMVPTGTVVGNTPEEKQPMYQEPLKAYKPTAIPIREGYTFADWYRDSEYKELFDFDNLIMPNGPMTVYAKWESNAREVLYYDGFGGSQVDREGVADGGYATHSFYVVGQNYEKGEFRGWYFELLGNLVPFNFDIQIWKDYKLYAQWKTNGFKVTYNADNGIGTLPVDGDSYELKTKARVLKGEGLTKGNDVFYAWKDSAGNLYYPGSLIEIPGNVMLTAQYAPENTLVRLTYISNYNGSTESLVVKVPKGTTTTLLGEYFKPAETDDKLVGWSNDSGSNNTKHYELNQQNYLANADKTFYGVWQFAGYTISFVTDGNGHFPTGAQDEYTGIAKNTSWDDEWVPEPIPNANYYFAGWEPSFPETVTKSQVFKATFKARTVIEVTADDANKTYDGTALTCGTAKVTVGDLKQGDILSVTMTDGSTITDVGTENNVIATYSITRGGVGVTHEYIVTTQKGTLTITPVTTEVVVNIKGNFATNEYDGNAHTVTGYEVESISNPLYTEGSFTFSGEASATRTDEGTTNMGLLATQFTNTNTNFSNVSFVIVDGYQTITPKAVTIVVADATKVYGEDDPAFAVDAVNGYIGNELDNITLTVIRSNAEERPGEYQDVLVLNETVAKLENLYKNYTFTVIPGTFTIEVKTDMPYTIEYYFQNVALNGYDQDAAYPAVQKTGTMETETAPLTNADYITREGFIFDANNASNILKAIISADFEAPTVLKLYYNRASYNVTYYYTNPVIPAGATALPATVTYAFGQDVTVVANATAPNYTFSGWHDYAQGTTFKMPAKDVSIYGSFAAMRAPLTIYYVYANGTTAAPTVNDTYDVGTAFSITSPIIAGYTANTAAIAASMTEQGLVYTVTYVVNDVPENRTFTIYEDDIPLAGIASRNVGDCAE